jgi:4-amino-4-deoxy-L-arabinose transferase-like glycosyltransferase
MDLLRRSGTLAPLIVAAIATRARGLCIDLFPYDEAHYSALAHKILAGAIPYVGAVDHKPVGIELTYAASFAVFGDRMWTLRLVAMIVVALTGWLVGRIAVSVHRDERAGIAGMLYVVASTWGMPGDMQGVNTELFANAALSLAAYLLVTRPRASVSWVAAGALTAVAGIYRYPALLTGGAWAMYALVGEVAPRIKLERLVALAGGFAAIAIAYAAAFWLAGAWDAFVFWGWRYNATYLTAPTFGEQLVAGARSLAITGAFWSALLVWARRPRAPLIVLWLGAAAIAILPGGRFFLHYFLAGLPAIAIAVAPSLLAATRRRAAGLVLAAAATVVSAGIVWGYGYLDPGFARDHQRYRAAGEFVRDHSSPSDRVFVWGSSHIYFYADRLMASRFFGCFYVTGMMWGSARDAHQFVVPRAWTELMADLERERPLYIVDTSPAALDGYDAYPLGAYPEIASFVARSYRVETTIDGVVIYRRVEPGARPDQRGAAPDGAGSSRITRTSGSSSTGA